MYEYDNESIRKEIILYLSECIDISIKTAAHYSNDTLEYDKNLKVLYDILNALYQLDKLDSEDSGR